MSYCDKINKPQNKDKSSSSSQSKQVASKRVSHPLSLIQSVGMNPYSITKADTRVMQYTIVNKAVGKPDAPTAMQRAVKDSVSRRISEMGAEKSSPVQREAENEEEYESLQMKKESNVKGKKDDSTGLLQMAMLSPQSLTEMDVMQLRGIMENRTVGEFLGETMGQTVQKTGSKTGLPDNLKAGVENLSELTMDDVRKQYNSDKPVQVGGGAVNGDEGVEKKGKQLGEKVVGRDTKHNLNKVKIHKDSVVQAVTRFYGEEKFKYPVRFLTDMYSKNKDSKNIGEDDTIIEDGGSSGIKEEPMRNFALNIGYSKHKRNALCDTLIKNNRKDLSDSFIAWWGGNIDQDNDIRIAERWIRENSKELEKIQDIKLQFISIIRFFGRVKRKHFFHYDSGHVKLTDEALEQVGCHDPNLRGLSKLLANGPNEEGWVIGHSGLFNRREHMYMEHIHVDKKDEDEIEIYKENKATVDNAANFKPESESKQSETIKKHVENAQKKCEDRQREADAKTFIIEESKLQ